MLYSIQNPNKAGPDPIRVHEISGLKDVINYNEDNSCVHACIMIIITVARREAAS